VSAATDGGASVPACGRSPRWHDIVAGFTDPIRDSEVRPNATAARVYDKLIEKYAACEREALGRL